MKKVLLALAATASLAACNSTKPEQKTAPQAKQQVLPPFVFTKDVQGAQQVGKGKVGYRFILLQPNSNQIAANQPFALTYAGGKLPFVTDGTNVYRGVTDARGMTPVFVFEGNVNQQGFVLLPRVGEGNTGGFVTLSNNQKEARRGMPYSMAVCGSKPYLFSNVTNSVGQTAYVAFNKGTKVQLLPYTNDEAQRKQQLAQVCPPAAQKAVAGAKKKSKAK